MKKSLAFCVMSALLIVLAAPAAALAAKRGDRNRDGLPDRWERTHKLSLTVDQSGRDQDGDGLDNRGEYLARTKPRDADSDNDNLSDADEDRDRDRVDNANEALERTDPLRADSDRDGVRDGREDADRDGLDNRSEDELGLNPIDDDSDGDGVDDGEETAGKVISFDDGVLVISVGGETVTGEVSERTEFDCAGEDDLMGAYDEDEADEDEASDDDDPIRAGISRAAIDDERTDDDDTTTDDGSGDDGTDDEQEACSIEDLAAGVVIHDAELERSDDGGLTFSKLAVIGVAEPQIMMVT